MGDHLPGTGLIVETLCVFSVELCDEPFLRTAKSLKGHKL